MGDDSDNNVGFEEGLSWLPSHILHDACGAHLTNNQEQLGCRARHYHYQYQHRYHHVINSQDSLPLSPGGQWRNGKKNYYNRTRYGNNNNRSNTTTGGPGMQAVFLEPSRKTCGTGVFLPQRAGTQLRPTKKSACSPVLLPYRVVQALNLNIQVLGLQTLSSNEGQKMNETNKIVHHSTSNKDVNDFRDDYDTISDSQTCSPELFLPKEWSY